MCWEMRVGCGGWEMGVGLDPMGKGETLMGWEAVS